MVKNRQTRNTILFIGMFLLAGTANLFSRTAVVALDAWMATANYVILIGLLLFWVESVQDRLLPSDAKRSVLSAAFLMLFYLLVRIFKYRFAVSVTLTRYAVYAYAIPQMMIPALFLMTCIRIRRGGQDKKKWNERLLLIPAIGLSALALTGDFHSLIYIPYENLSRFVVTTGTYGVGAGFYLMYAWMILTIAFGLFILFREAGKQPKKVIWLLAGLTVLWLGLVLLTLFLFDRIPGFPRLFNVPELHIFGLLGIFEVCIHYRLIPYNENYSGFFRKIGLPTMITDRKLHPAYDADSILQAGPDSLSASLREPVYLTPDQRLYGKRINAGYAFWLEDETIMHQIQKELSEANEMIEEENDLIQAETVQKEKDAYLQSRHRIYHEIAEELYPCQKRVDRILEQAVPGTDGFRKKIAEVSVLNAYVKRKTNLLLLAAEKDELGLEELYISLQESAGYLTLTGTQTTVEKPENSALPSKRIILMYDTFEAVMEQLAGKVSAVMVSWSEHALLLAAETEISLRTEGLPLPVQVRIVDGVQYLYIDFGTFSEEGR